jgi:hypothetical protein
MKAFRLLGLAAVLALTFLAPAKQAFASCSSCTSNQECRNCTGDPEAFCVGHRCAV